MSAGTVSPPPPLILVVDDEAMLRFLAADTLEESGFRVVEAENAKEALKVLAEQSDVRVLFTDINMPGALDGLDLAREVHARWPTIKLIVTSGRLRLSDGEIPDSGRFVAKPYSPDTLVEEIRQATGET
ncbi:MAG: response regulator [Janthinobacterium lividum]